MYVLPCDLWPTRDAVEKLVPSAEEKMEKLDILVANAGVAKDNLFDAIARRELGSGHRPHRCLTSTFPAGPRPAVKP